MGKSKEQLVQNEKLLSAWLVMSAGVRNDRLVQTMTFNEIFVCSCLYAKDGGVNTDSRSLTATDLCAYTGLLKSQMNKVLNGLEKQGFLMRRRCEQDQRKLYLSLTEQGCIRYEQEHERILALVQTVTDALGVEKSAQLTDLLQQVAVIMKG